MCLLLSDHRALHLVFLSHLLHELFRLLADFKSVQALFVQLVLLLLLDVIHLTLEVLLDFLVLPEFYELTLFSLHLVSPSVFVNYAAPESVLLFLSHRNDKISHSPPLNS